MIGELDVARFKRDGFLLLKGVFSPAEVARLNEVGATAVRSTDLHALPAVASIWRDARLIDIAKRLLGPSITFFGEASYLHEVFRPGEKIIGRHLHHDAKGTIEHLFNRQHAPTADPYPIIRFAIYLQDHANMSGGLKLVPGSHQFDSIRLDQRQYTYLDVPSQPGDLVVFCNKILHSPYALRRKSQPDIGLAPLEEVRMAVEDPEALLPTPIERNVIFVDFAGHNALADIYIKGRAINTINPREGFVATFENGALRKDAEEAGVDLRMDGGIIEAITKITSTLENGKISQSGVPYLAALPRLCRMSKSWSPHFEFVPQEIGDDSVESAIKLFSAIHPRVQELRALRKTMRVDTDMANYEYGGPAG